MSRLQLLVLVCLMALPAMLVGQEVGDRVILESSNPDGVPVHPGPTDNAYVRWSNETVAEVTSTDSPRGWIEVEADGRSGWVVRRYAAVLLEPGDDTPDEPGEELPTYVVGTWNLEWLNDNRIRGFPEYLRNPPGPKYDPRTEEDYQRIAEVIEESLDASILVLNEINGRPGEMTSVELDRLVSYLGHEWTYVLTASGGSQRVAILSNTKTSRRDSCLELTVAEERIDGKDVFDKDPLACVFTMLGPDGTPQNDLIVVGLHLASGQDNASNHNRAMEILMDRLHEAVDDGLLPQGERDLLVAGDLNASRYDSAVEDFWNGLDETGYALATLAPTDGTLYPGTRLAGVPLYPRSQIDYLMASATAGGLLEELPQLTAQVHTGLLPDNFNEFREHFSDHLPVTIRVRVVADDDPN